MNGISAVQPLADTRHFQQGHNPVLLRGLWNSLFFYSFNLTNIFVLFLNFVEQFFFFFKFQFQHSSTSKFWQVKA